MEYCHYILVVDDDDQIPRMLSKVLLFFGYAVSLASNGQEGVREFLRRSYDLVLTDLDMPVMDGMKMASHIKALSPFTPIVLMTGCVREEVMEKGSGNHVDHILFKPFKLTEVKEVITKMITPTDGGENGYHIDRGRSAPSSRTVPRGNAG